jgi:two-component system response regulator
MDDSTDVLVVEEDNARATLALEALRRRGEDHRHFDIISGDEALEFVFAAYATSSRAELHLPRLIVLDLDLHGVNSFDILRELRGNELTRLIPVVVLASSLEAIKEVESLGLPVNSCVLKPADNRRFTQLISDVGYYWLTVDQSVHP